MLASALFNAFCFGALICPCTQSPLDFSEAMASAAQQNTVTEQTYLCGN